MTMKIGIYGGSFSPIHETHITVAKEAKKRFMLDFVYMVPTDIQPFKRGIQTPSQWHRKVMLMLATEEHDELVVGMFDKGISYTIKTILGVKAMHPDDKLFLIMGMDSYQTFPYWKKAEKIAELVTFIVCGRPGYKPDGVDEEMMNRHGMKPKALFMNDIQFDVSSTEVRNGNLDNVDPKVAFYIKEHCLYGFNMDEASIS
jgi:nicotinate-nucleotide adenylyltransferase